MTQKYRFELCAGTLGCLVWPILFGYSLADPDGGQWGIHLGLATIAILITPLVIKYETAYKYLARGSWIVALISALPILPISLGGFIIDTILKLYRHDYSGKNFPTLKFGTAYIVTVVYSVTYVIGSITMGWIVYKGLNRDKSNQSVKSSP